MQYTIALTSQWASWCHQQLDGLFNSLFRLTSKKHQRSPLLVLCGKGIHRWPVDSPHKGPVMQKTFPFMMTSSNGNIFRVTGPLCGEFTGPGEFPTQRPVTRSFDVFFDLRPNKRLSKQWRGWWFETLSRPFWRHRNVSWHHRVPSVWCYCNANDKGDVMTYLFNLFLIHIHLKYIWSYNGMIYLIRWSSVGTYV